ncbi:MAG: hypothetical protein JWO52_5666 [Gammaproteobacteria bacterium]|nr:hypothetical protein [Gammaproteobacteria bacterium]
MSNPLLYVIAGFFVGGMVGLTGVGGGSLMTPILVLIFGQSPAVAVGTDLVFSATTKLAATASFGYSRRVDWRIVGRLALGSIPGAAAIIFWFWTTRHTPGVIENAIARALAVILAVAAAAMLLQYPLRRVGLRLTSVWLERAERYTLPLTVVTGLLLGVAVTLTSVGAGALGVVALLALYPFRLTGDRLVATDIAHAVPVTAIAGATHAMLGHVDLHMLGFLLAGSIPGVLMASRATVRLPAPLTNTLVAIMLAFVSKRMLFGN